MDQREVDFLIKNSRLLSRNLKKDLGVPAGEVRQIRLPHPLSLRFRKAIFMSGYAGLSRELYELAPYYPVVSRDGLSVEYFVEGERVTSGVREFVTKHLREVEDASHLMRPDETNALCQLVSAENMRHDLTMLFSMKDVMDTMAVIGGDKRVYSWVSPVDGSVQSCEYADASIVYPIDRTDRGCKYDNNLESAVIIHDGKLLMSAIVNRKTKGYTITSSSISTGRMSLDEAGYYPEDRILSRKRLSAIKARRQFNSGSVREGHLVPQLAFYDTYAKGVHAGPSYIIGKRSGRGNVFATIATGIGEV